MIIRVLVDDHPVVRASAVKIANEPAMSVAIELQMAPIKEVLPPRLPSGDQSISASIPACALILTASCGAPALEQSATLPPPARSLDFEEARRGMLDEIRRLGLTDARVLEAMSQVPRHEFVPAEYQAYAYADTPLPIGLDQTISQPYVVALMTALVDPEPSDRLLEVGTGSGYQAAVVARLVADVYSIEIVSELARSAAARLERLGVSNVTVREGDGYLGWPEQAPFDGILVTAGATEIPAPLVEQLAPGGRMVIPVGGEPTYQTLQVLEKQSNGEIEVRDVIPVRFVPLLRDSDETPGP
jgi:protein-L-isoaspartate(D-aspartate) O-methyltransferase